MNSVILSSAINKCVNDAVIRNCHNVSQWQLKNPQLHRLADENGILEDIEILLPTNTKQRWTLELCQAEASKHKNCKAWQNACIRSYTTAHRRGWFDQCYPLMSDYQEEWTLERCMAEAATFELSSDWKISQLTSYEVAKRNGWINECHQAIVDAWTLEKCIESSKYLTHKSQWIRKDRTSYRVAEKKGWIEICLEEAKKLQKTVKIKDCVSDAAQYQSLKAWKNANPSFYEVAEQRKGWLKKCRDEQVKTQKRWTLEMCLESALGFTNKKTWERNDQFAYIAALFNDWIDVCCTHMIVEEKYVRSFDERNVQQEQTEASC